MYTRFSYTLISLKTVFIIMAANADDDNTVEIHVPTQNKCILLWLSLFTTNPQNENKSICFFMHYTSAADYLLVYWDIGKIRGYWNLTIFYPKITSIFVLQTSIHTA